MMTKAIIGVASGMLALGVSGCEKKPATPPPDKSKTIGDTMKDAAKNAGDTLDQAAKEAKDKAVSAAQDVYDSAKKEFDALAAKVSSSSSPEKSVWQQTVDTVKSRFAEADQKLSDLRVNNSDWKKISGELNDVLTKIKDGIKSLAAQVK